MVYTEEKTRTPLQSGKGQFVIKIFVTSIVPILSETMVAKAEQ